MSEPVTLSAVCLECSRRVGLRPKGEGWVIRVHSKPGAGRCSATGRAAIPEDDGRAMAEAAASMDPGERPIWPRALEVYELTAVSKGGRRLTERTLRKYRPHLRGFSAWCKASGVDSPPDLTFDTLRTFHGLTVGEQVSARDAQVIAAVRSFTRWAGEHWPASLPSPSRVARACPMVKVQSSPHPVLSKGDAEAVGRYLSQLIDVGEISQLKDAACLVLAAYAGLRRSEITRLDLVDIEDAGPFARAFDAMPEHLFFPFLANGGDEGEEKPKQKRTPSKLKYSTDTSDDAFWAKPGIQAVCFHTGAPFLREDEPADQLAVMTEDPLALELFQWVAQLSPEGRRNLYELIQATAKRRKPGKPANDDQARNDGQDEGYVM